MKVSFFSDTVKNEQIRAYLGKCLLKYGKMNYAYLEVDKRNTDNIVIISDLPDYFSDVYLENKHQDIDPVLIESLHRVSPFSWDENLMINSQWKLSKIFYSVKPFHNIVSGHTFVLHDPNNNMALLSLYINKFMSPDTDDCVTNHKDEIQGLLLRTHEMLVHLYSKEENNKENGLTPREEEILYWSSTGKTYPEIAHMLGVAVSTVKFHMGKIVKKLGVKNAKHAIRLSTELNLSPGHSKNKIYRQS